MRDVLLSIIKMSGAGINQLGKSKNLSREQIIFSAGCCFNGIIGTCIEELERIKELSKEQSHD
jgi:hypothetical protein